MLFYFYLFTFFINFYHISGEFTILIWFKRPWHKNQTCKVLNCSTTLDNSQLSKVSSVIINDFHMVKDKIQKKIIIPDKKINPKALYVYALYESSVRNWKKKDPQSFKFPKNYFNVINTYVPSSDIIHNYSGPWIHIPLLKSNLSMAVKTKYNKILKDKNNSIVWVVSNCITDSGREKAIKLLSKYISVIRYGKCNNKPLPSNSKIFKSLYNKSYFFIASENTDCKGYITEKYWSRYRQLSIPIVNVRNIYKNVLPPHSFIAMDDYKSPKEMANHLKYLIMNKKKYLEYFNYRYEGWFNAEQSQICNLCNKLMFLKENRQNFFYDDPRRWLKREDYCYPNNYVYNKWKSHKTF